MAVRRKDRFARLRRVKVKAEVEKKTKAKSILRQAQDYKDTDKRSKEKNIMQKAKRKQ